MRLSGFWKNLLTFGIYALFSKYKAKNKENEWTLLVDTLLASRVGAPVTRAQMLDELNREMARKNLTEEERILAIALLSQRLDKLGL